MTTHTKYRADIDGLRAIAVLAVVGYHAFPGKLLGGFIGVDVFFVISGFLISSIIFRGQEQHTFSFVDFYSRRIKRIFPALTVVLIACISFGWFALLADEYEQLGKHVAAGAGFVSNFVLWKEAGYFDNSGETKPLLHLWSLGIEEQFYIVWPLLLWLARKNRISRLFVCLLIIGVSFSINLYSVRSDTVSAFYSPLSRFWELIAGGLLAHFTLDNSGPPAATLSSNLKAVAGILLILGAAALMGTQLRFPGWWALFPTLGAVLVVSAGPQAWLNRTILANRVLVWFGLISYPLYLWHWPLLAFARIVESRLPPRNIREAAIALSIALAWLTYRFLERPIRSSNRNALKVATLCSLMACVGLAGLAVYKHGGFPLRASVSGFKDNNKELIRTPEMDDACKNYVSNQNPVFPYCRFHDVGGSETIAVIGDSHAHAAFPGIAEIAAAANKNTALFGNHGCPPFLGAIWIPESDNSSALACTRRIEELVESVKAKSDIHKVFIITRGPVYISGMRFGYPDAPPIRAANPSDKDAPDEIFRKSLQATVDSLRQANKDVYYVLENPELVTDPGACVARPFRLNKKDCEVPVSQVLQWQATYRKLVAELKNVTIIDPLSAFCPDERCRVFEEGELLYADSDHLSTAGSRLQARQALLRFVSP